MLAIEKKTILHNLTRCRRNDVIIVGDDFKFSFIFQVKINTLDLDLRSYTQIEDLLKKASMPESNHKHRSALKRIKYRHKLDSLNPDANLNLDPDSCLENMYVNVHSVFSHLNFILPHPTFKQLNFIL